MKNKNGFVAIPLIILALISITFGIGYAMQRQSKNTVITAQNENATSSGTINCKCNIQKSDILTKKDVLSIILENKTLLKGEKGEQGIQGVQGPRGDSITGPVGAIGSIGPVGPKGDMTPGKFVRLCFYVSNKKIGWEEYPVNKNASSQGYLDYCDSIYGKVLELWVK